MILDSFPKYQISCTDQVIQILIATAPWHCTMFATPILPTCSIQEKATQSPVLEKWYLSWVMPSGSLSQVLKTNKSLAALN